MKYKLHLVKDVTTLTKLAEKQGDKLFALTNDRDDALIQSKNSEKATVKKADYIADVTSKLAAANARLSVLPDGPEKDKQIGEVKTLDARLYKLNLPGETTNVDVVVDHELDAELQSLVIGGL